MPDIVINAVAFREGDVYVVQGVNYDIVAHASDAADVPRALCRAVAENVCITHALGRSAMEGVPAAPSRFQRLFDEAITRIDAIDPAAVTAGLNPRMDIRLAHGAA